MQFGIEGAKLVTMKTILNWMNAQLDSLLSKENALNAWYDVHLMRLFHAHEDELDEFDEDQDMLQNDNDDFDLDLDVQ
jgi:hypothetical protein